MSVCIRYLSYTFTAFMLGFYPGCGLKTPPAPLPELLPETAFDTLRLSFRGDQLRFSWKIHGPGQQLIKSSKTFPDTASPSFVIDFFQVKTPCPDCENGWLQSSRIGLNSKKMIVEQDRLFLYQPIPVMETKGEQQIFRIRLLDQEDMDLLPPAIVRLSPRPDFPSPPQPEIRTLQVVQGFTEHSFVMDLPSFPERENTASPTSLLSAQQSNVRTRFSAEGTIITEQDDKKTGSGAFLELTRSRIDHIRFTWPPLFETVYQRFPEPGEPRYQNRAYQVNLYRINIDGTHRETPLNAKPIGQTVYLWEVKTNLSLPGPSPRLADSHPRLLADRALFYIDLQPGKRDTEWYELRLVDRFGNESPSSPPAPHSPPGITIAELSWGAQAISPAAY